MQKIEIEKLHDEIGMVVEINVCFLVKIKLIIFKPCPCLAYKTTVFSSTWVRLTNTGHRRNRSWPCLAAHCGSAGQSLVQTTICLRELWPNCLYNLVVFLTSSFRGSTYLSCSDGEENWWSMCTWPPWVFGGHCAQGSRVAAVFVCVTCR